MLNVPPYSKWMSRKIYLKTFVPDFYYTCAIGLNGSSFRNFKSYKPCERKKSRMRSQDTGIGLPINPPLEQVDYRKNLN